MSRQNESTGEAEHAKLIWRFKCTQRTVAQNPRPFELLTYAKLRLYFFVIRYRSILQLTPPSLSNLPHKIRPHFLYFNKI